MKICSFVLLKIYYNTFCKESYEKRNYVGWNKKKSLTTTKKGKNESRKYQGFG